MYLSLALRCRKITQQVSIACHRQKTFLVKFYSQGPSPSCKLKPVQHPLLHAMPLNYHLASRATAGRLEGCEVSRCAVCLWNMWHQGCIAGGGGDRRMNTRRNDKWVDVKKERSEPGLNRRYRWHIKRVLRAAGNCKQGDRGRVRESGEVHM